MSSDAPTAAPTGGLSFLRKHNEVIIAILLGVVSIATAYASFQSSLYGGMQAQKYTIGSNLATEAESLYLEGNQQFVQDSQLFDRLTDLQLDIENPDPAISEAAQVKYDTIYFQSVSEEFDAAIQNAAAQNEADPEFYYSPMDDEDYQASLFGTYAETKEEAKQTIAEGDEANALGDKLTLATVIMAVSLFLLGIAAVVSSVRMKLIMGGVGVVIFVVAGIITATVPVLTL